MIWVIVAIYAAMLALFIYAMCDGPHGGSYIHEDGRIVEWDGDGGGRILYPDGTLVEYPRADDDA